MWIILIKLLFFYYCTKGLHTIYTKLSQHYANILKMLNGKRVLGILKGVEMARDLTIKKKKRMHCVCVTGVTVASGLGPIIDACSYNCRLRPALWIHTVHSVIFHILKMSNYFLNATHFCFLWSILEWGKCRGLICCRARRLPLCPGGFWECCNWRCGLYAARTGNPDCKSNTTVSVLILCVCQFFCHLGFSLWKFWSVNASSY